MALRRLLALTLHLRTVMPVRTASASIVSLRSSQSAIPVHLRTLTTASVSKNLLNAGIKRFRDPSAMQNDLDLLTQKHDLVRNYVGVIEDMSSDKLVVETELFPPAALEFYTRYNLCQTSDDDEKNHSKYYNAARGGAQGDYRKDIQKKIDNVVDCLSKFPQSKRAYLTIAPLSTDHTSDGDAKCLRELHFYLENDRLCCSGFMRAQASAIFPKNIHFIGTVMHQIAARLNKKVGSYTHFVTTLVNAR